MTTGAPGADRAVSKVAKRPPAYSAAGVRRSLVTSAPIFLVLLVLLIAIGVMNPRGFDAGYYVALLKRAAPLMVLAAGQLFVIVSGEFDLSVGSIVSAVVVGAALLTFGDPAATYPVMAVLLVFGIIVGLTNGFVTTKLRVPSFLATLGMLLVLQGGVAAWTAGAPRGSLHQEFRVFGREGVTGLPVIGELPYSVIILAAFGALLFWLLHRTNFGQQVFAVGGNARAASLAGISVARVRSGAFVLSAVSAIVAGILVAGFGGLSNRAGEGYEFQAISAVVLGGAVLGGGRGSVLTAMAGALTLSALFALLNFMGQPNAVRFVVQGLIIIGAVAYASYRLRQSGS